MCSLTPASLHELCIEIIEGVYSRFNAFQHLKKKLNGLLLHFPRSVWSRELLNITNKIVSHHGIVTLQVELMFFSCRQKIKFMINVLASCYEIDSSIRQEEKTDH